MGGARKFQNFHIPQVFNLRGSTLFDTNLLTIDRELNSVVIAALLFCIIDIGITTAAIDDHVDTETCINSIVAITQRDDLILLRADEVIVAVA